MFQRKISTNIVEIPPLGSRKAELHFLPKEKELRREAFESVDMLKTESFFTDNDLKCPFSFLLVRDSASDSLLLSSRAYTDQSTIQTVISPVIDSDYLLMTLAPTKNYVFLDRLVTSAFHPQFLANRSSIFRHFYTMVLQRFQRHDIILMARSEPNERLLTKYIRLGFHIVGKKTHNGVLHYIIHLDHVERFKVLKMATWTYIFLRFKFRK